MWTVLDIAKTAKYDTAFYDFTTKIVKNNDRLKKNYTKIKKDQFVCLTAVFDLKSEIIAVSGLQLNQAKWGPHIGRILSRMAIAPDHRYKIKYLLGNTISFTELMLPLQIDCARSMNLDSVFFSRDRGLRSLRQLCKKIEHRVPKICFEVEPKKINVCGPVSKASDCYQYVAKLYLNEQDSSRWSQF